MYVISCTFHTYFVYVFNFKSRVCMSMTFPGSYNELIEIVPIIDKIFLQTFINNFTITLIRTGQAAEAGYHFKCM